MDQAAINAVFLPKLNRQEEKADAITKTVRAIMNAEAAKRESKTERLRAARLERDAKMPAAPVKVTRAASRRVK